MEDIQRVLREAHIAGLRAVKNGISGVVVKPVGLEFKFIEQTQLGFFQEEGFIIDYKGQTARRSLEEIKEVIFADNQRLDIKDYQTIRDVPNDTSVNIHYEREKE